MATHSSIFAWKIPRTEESGGLQTMGLQGVSHALATEHAHMHMNLMYCSSFYHEDILFL